VNKLADELNVVSWHNELLIRSLGSRGECQSDCDVGGSDEQLGSVVGHERSVTTALLFGEDLCVSSGEGSASSFDIAMEQLDLRKPAP
jgi:hypothetical protein